MTLNFSPQPARVRAPAVPASPPCSGPTNTGKTHLAIERMLAHSSGMIGLPLRLLAREVYNKVVDRAGVGNVALITGEEKIKPPNPRFCSLIRRNREWLDKGLVDIHASIEIPKGERHPRFAQVPELKTFAKSDRERKMVEMFRAFRIAGQNFFLPPGVPKERVQILTEAMRKTLSDPEFMKEYQKLSGETPSPLAAEALEKVVRELPRGRQCRRAVQQTRRR